MRDQGQSTAVVSRSHSWWAAGGAAIAVALGGGGLAVTYATSSSGERDVFVPITPCRLFDTRPDSLVGTRNTPIGAAGTMLQPVTGNTATARCRRMRRLSQ